MALPVEGRARDGFMPRATDIVAATDGFDGRVRSLLLNTANSPTGSLYGRAGQVWEGEHLSLRARRSMAERTWSWAPCPRATR